MNAIDSSPIPAAPQDETTLLAPLRTTRRLAGTLLAVTLVLGGVAASRTHLAVVGPPLAAVLVAFAAATCTLTMAWARRRAALPRRAVAARWRLIRLLHANIPRGDPSVPARAAKLPQVLIAVPLCAAAIAAGCLVPPAVVPLDPRRTYLLIGGALLLAFPVLIAERSLAQPHIARAFPEAPALRALLVLLLLCLVGGALLSLAAGLGYGGLAIPGLRALGVVPMVVAAELGVRALARLFLPPSLAAEANGAATSTVALILAEGTATRSLAAPIRHHLGLDFARGFALRFVRAALPSVALCVALAAWGVTAAVPVPSDQRAIYERFGAPVKVLHPGLHLILPWPFGRVRMVEFGRLHVLPFGDVTGTEQLVAAEADPPPSADRLWEQPHPAEVTFLIASQNSGRQNFQVVSADVRAIWRVGLTNADALRASYAVMDPPALLRAAAGRVIAAFFAGETLPAVLGEARETRAARLQTAIQAELEREGAGIELTSLVIEAVHPPAGAAGAYHAVQAAEIIAKTQVSAEQGHAQAMLSKTAQYTAQIVTIARGSAADGVAAARAKASAFIADVGAARAGGPSFLLNRYLSDLVDALSQTPLTIVDSRIPAPDAPMLDLRPLTGPPPPAVGAE